MDSLHIMLIAIGIEAVVLASLLLLMIHASARNSSRKVRRLRDDWRRAMPDAVHGRRNAVERIRRTLRTEAELRLFQQFIDARLKGPEKHPALESRALCRHLGFTDWLKAVVAESRDELERAAAAKTLGHLREPMPAEHLRQLLNSDDPAVVLSSGYAAASTRDTSLFLVVLRAIYQRTPITLHGSAEVLSRFGPGVCPIIHRLLENILVVYNNPGLGLIVDDESMVNPADVASQVIMIDLLAFFRHFPSSKVLFELIKHTEHDEVLIHLVKAMAKLGGMRTARRLRPLLSHENWVVRSQTAGALAALRAHEATAQIEVLLSDPEVRVRTAALRALSTLQLARTEVKVAV